MNLIPMRNLSIGLCAVLLAARAAPESPRDDQPGVGDLLPRIVCPKEYEARVFAIGLKSPDGLAMDAVGRVLVVEETAGRVTRIGEDGKHQVVARGLRSPEGICVGEDGEFFVAEDFANGRLLHFTKGGEQTVLATGLDAPEGVLYVHGTLYFTESDAQLVENQFAMRTRVSRIERSKGGGGTFGPVELLIERRLPYSFSELASDGALNLLLANEIANSRMSAGLMRLNLTTKKLDTFAIGLHSPEGLCKANPNAITDLPLLIAEEQVVGLQGGRLSLIERSSMENQVGGEDGKKKTALPGIRSTFATGFLTLEDVLVAPNGSIFVTEDASGMIIELRPKRGAAKFPATHSS